MIFVIAIVLIAASALYAWLLNKRAVREWYTPDRTWITVVVGAGLILAALGALALAGELAWRAWLLDLGYTCAAGAPIIVWQCALAYKRHRRAAQILERE